MDLRKQKNSSMCNKYLEIVNMFYVKIKVDARSHLLTNGSYMQN